MLRNMAQSLIEHGQLRTTLSKAKTLKPFVEKLITLAKRARGGDLIARRLLMKDLCDRAMIPADRLEDYEMMSDAARAKVLRAKTGRRHRTGEARTGTPFTAESVARKLINEIAADFEDRSGGYTRIIKLADTRIGDGSALAVIQFVGQEEEPGSVRRGAPTARRKRAEARYAMVEKGSPRERRAATKAKAERKADARKAQETDEAEAPSVAETPEPDEVEQEPPAAEAEADEQAKPADAGDGEASQGEDSGDERQDQAEGKDEKNT